MARILIISGEYPPISGGAGVYTMNLVNSLIDKGYDLKVLLPSYSKGVDNREMFEYKILFSLNKNRIIRKYVNYFYLIFNALMFAKFFKNNKFDYVLVSEQYAFLCIGLYNLFFREKIKFIMTVHGTEGKRLLNNEKKIQKKILKKFSLRAFSYCSVVLSVSHYANNLIKKKLNDNNIGEQISCVVLNNSVPANFSNLNESEFNKFKNSFYSKYKISKDELLLLSIGRITFRKGFDIAVKAFGKLGYGHVKYIIVGDGEELDNLKFSSNENILFLGEIKNRVKIKFLYKMADVFILPSRIVKDEIESFATVLLEASSFGLPLVASNIQGNPEIVKDGYNGLLFENENVDELSQVLNKLVNDKELRTFLGQRSYSYFIKNFTSEIIAEKFIKILHNIKNENIGY